MISRLGKTFWRQAGSWTGGALLVLLLMPAVGAQTAKAQVADSAAVDTVRDEPFAAPPSAPPDSVRSQDVGPGEQERALVSADSLSALERAGERMQELFDNVSVKQDTTRLRSNFALRYLERDELLFTGEVVIYERGDTLRADTVRYNKQTKVGHARGNVRLTDGEVVVRAPEATYYTEEKRSVFPDSVTLVDSSRVLHAQAGTYWSDERRAEFQGHVRLTDPETYLESDSLTYFRDDGRSIAKGRVFIRRQETEPRAPRRPDADSVAVDSSVSAPPDTTSRTYLFGDWVDNQEQQRYSRVEGRAILVRVRMDSTGAPEDTMAVRAQQLEAIRTDTHRRLIAVDSVRIWQSDLAAVADSAVYDRVVAPGRGDSTEAPAPLPDSAETQPASERQYATVLDSLVAETDPPFLATSVDTSTAESSTRPDRVAEADSLAAPRDPQRAVPDSLRGPPAQRPRPSPTDSTRRRGPQPPGGRAGPRVWDRPVARSEADVPLEETRLFQAPVTWFERAQVWGDSIRVRAQDRSLDTVFVRGAAFAAQQDTVVDRIQQLKGKDITAFFRSDSLRRIRAEPNAQAIRFFASKQDSLKGAAKASGDRIVLRFRQGTVKRISVIGGVQSSYYRTPEDIPDPFHLEGFQWTPERKPTKRGILRESRVRERLDIDEQRRPPLARQRRASDSSTEEARGTGARRDSGAPAQGRLRRRNESPSQPYRPDSLSVPPDSLRPGAPPRPEAAAADTTDTATESDPE